MKSKVVIILVFALVMCSVFGFSSCGDDDGTEYKMVEFITEGLVYKIPSHFDMMDDPDGEANLIYVTRTATVAVYVYDKVEIREKFEEYEGEVVADPFANYLVQFHGYGCEVRSNGDDRATYSFMHIPENSETVYHYNAVMLSRDETIYMISMSCELELFDYYADMFTEMVESIHFEEDAE